MNTEWSLEVYYKGYEDPAFAEDFELLQKNAQALETALGQAREQDDVQGLVTVLEAKEAYAKVLFKLKSIWHFAIPWTQQMVKHWITSADWIRSMHLQPRHSQPWISI